VSSEPGQDDPIPLLYVGGFGRSGSTVLALLLGQDPHSFVVGEVVHLWERGLKGDERCGCGEAFNDCLFWTAVGEAAFGGWENLDLDEVLALQQRVDRNRFIPKAMFPRLFPSYQRDLLAYGEILTTLYRAIRQVAGVECVVDTSKHASLAYVLAQVPSIDLRVVHLVRDSRAVAHSWMRKKVRPEVTDQVEYMPRYSPWESATRWLSYNLLLGFLRGVPVRRLRYEDFMSDPVSSVRAQLGLAGLHVDPHPDYLGDTWAELTPTHTVAGNPMRFSEGRIQLKQDDAWLSEMPGSAKRIVTALTWPLLARYGYLGRDSKPGTTRKALPPTEASRPAVSVIIATHNRPQLVRRAMKSVLGQRYSGDIEVVVVFDKTSPDEALVQDELFGGHQRTVRVISNEATPGLAGARNSGLAVAQHGILAFCDDDDAWFADKLAKQVGFLESHPDFGFIVTGIEIEFDARFTERIPDFEEITVPDLLRSRIVEAHPSGYLFTRTALDAAGPVDETLAGGYAEDYDFILRMAKNTRVGVVQEPLVTVLWGRTSFYAEGWQNRIAALNGLVERHPEFEDDDLGMARIQGQIAFAHASLGDKAEARSSAKQTLRLHRSEPRAYLALLVSTGLVSSSLVVRSVQRFGRGI
jgi:Glycosyl transferase family 2/Sulfotransferase family